MRHANDRITATLVPVVTRRPRMREEASIKNFGCAIAAVQNEDAQITESKIQFRREVFFHKLQ